MLSNKYKHVALLMASLFLITTESSAGGNHEQQGMLHDNHSDMHWQAPEAMSQRQNPQSPNAASILNGEKLYQQNCMICHGQNGLGDGSLAQSLQPPPSNLRMMVPMHADGDIAWKIAEGRGAMPSWKNTLSESEIWDLVNYLNQLSADNNND